MADKKKDYLKEQHYHARQLVRVPNVCWEPILEQLPVLEFLLPEDDPSDSFYLVFHNSLGRKDRMRVEKALTTCIVYQKLFYFFEQQMPPVLSASFYEPHPPSIQKLAVSSWFATRSCLLDLQMPLVKDMPSSRNDDDAKPSSTSQAELQRWECCTFCKSLKDSLPGYCSMLQCVGETLSGWMAPKEFNPAEDQIKSAAEFIESPEVIKQFSVNFTLRQQWLAIALATLLKFELEALPLKLWPVPKKFSAEVVQVTTFIKVTKECILFGSMSHENDLHEEIQFFETELMPQVVSNLAVMSSDIALHGLRDLKEKCSFTTGGFRVSKESWKLNDLLEVYYRRHQWNFGFYTTWGGHFYKSRSYADSVEDVENLMDYLASTKTTTENSAEPSSGSLNDIYLQNLYYGYEETFTALKALGWLSEGKYVRKVLEVVATRGFASKAQIEKLLKKEVFTRNISIKIIREKNYKDLDVLDKLSCLSLALLYCVLKFRVSGKILHDNPQSLVGILVSYSLQLFETELQLRIAELAGAYCGFEPVIYLKKTNYYYTELTNLISKASIRASQTVDCPADPADNNSPSAFFALKDQLMRHWLIHRKWMLHNVKSDEMYELEAALFSYLIPCYLSAFIESNNGDDKGVIFFGSVLRLLLIKSSSMLDTSLRRPAKVPVRDSADLIAQMWELQNKILQMVNAFVDHGSCRVSECLAKIFANNNWFMLQCSESKINHVLAKCLPDLNYLLQHYHALFSCVLQTIGTTTSTLPTAPSEFVTEMQELHTSLEKCSKFVISVQAECAMTTDVKFLFELEKFMGDILPLESQAHTWHSELFYRLLVAEHFDAASNDSFLSEARDVLQQLIDCIVCALKSKKIVCFSPILIAEAILEQYSQMTVEKTNGKATLKKRERKLDLSLQDVGHLYQVLKPAAPQEPAANKLKHLSDTQQKPPNKVKKDLKPSKEVLLLLEKEAKEKECRTCQVCGKKESAHRHVFITCAECVKKSFPKIHHYCSKVCQSEAWISYHEEQHILFDLNMYKPSEEKD